MLQQVYLLLMIVGTLVVFAKMYMCDRKRGREGEGERERKSYVAVDQPLKFTPRYILIIHTYCVIYNSCDMISL